ncbi:MAG: hypothetical protein ACI9LO_001668 [Planctomycetota bacterium]|jgi:hypothetical protein
MNRIDHIVIAAHTLAQGVDFVRDRLGVDIPAGGFHQTMGTHNHLMQLGNQSYLEVIAIDPAAVAPRHPRWFGLDDALMRAALEQQPRLITWVMNTTDLAQLAAQTGFDIGLPTMLARNNLRWEFALPDDGRLLANGLLPYCIQWHSAHPAHSMADPGCSLVKLSIYHNRIDWIRARLDSMNALDLVELIEIDDNQKPRLSATIATPKGRVIL